MVHISDASLVLSVISMAICLADEHHLLTKYLSLSHYIFTYVHIYVSYSFCIYAYIIYILYQAVVFKSTLMVCISKSVIWTSTSVMSAPHFSVLVSKSYILNSQSILFMSKALISCACPHHVTQCSSHLFDFRPVIRVLKQS